MMPSHHVIMTRFGIIKSSFLSKSSLTPTLDWYQQITHICQIWVHLGVRCFKQFKNILRLARQKLMIKVWIVFFRNFLIIILSIFRIWLSVTMAWPLNTLIFNNQLTLTILLKGSSKIRKHASEKAHRQEQKAFRQE